MPLIRPVLVTVVLLTFIGPWNDFLWPFLITKRADISNVAGSAANPFGAVLAGAVVLAAPVVILFIVFQRYFVASHLGSGVKG